jgi:hypothetical protein
VNGGRASWPHRDLADLRHRIPPHSGGETVTRAGQPRTGMPQTRRPGRLTGDAETAGSRGATFVPTNCVRSIPVRPATTTTNHNYNGRHHLDTDTSQRPGPDLPRPLPPVSCYAPVCELRRRRFHVAGAWLLQVPSPDGTL